MSPRATGGAVGRGGGRGGRPGQAVDGGGRRGARSAPAVAGKRGGAAGQVAGGVAKAAPAKAASARTALAKASPARAAAAKAPGPPRRGVAGLGSGATSAFPLVQYLGSLEGAGGLPSTVPEFALIGRSNVGKSSLLNALCGSRKLARTGRTPGRTQRIHIFEVESAGGAKLRLCDLPGYGHAAAGAAVAASFGPMIEGFLLGRPLLRRVLLLWDARRTPDEETLGFLLWLREQRVVFDVVVTKVDKLSHTGRGATLAALQRALELPYPPLATSATDGAGVEALRDRLCAWALHGQGPRRP